MYKLIFRQTLVKCSTNRSCVAFQRFCSSPPLKPPVTPPTQVKSNNDGSSSSKNSKSKNPSRGPVTYFSLAAAFVAFGGVVVYYRIKKEESLETINHQKPITTGKPALGGTWSLVDQDGIPRTSADYTGKFTLLYFGFTHCPDICPSELVKVGKIMEILEKKGLEGALVPIFISVDPPRDTIGQLKNYAQDFHHSMVYMTGTPEQIAKVAKVYRVYFSKANEVIDVDGQEEYLVDHSIVLYLHDSSGEFLDFFTQKTQVNDIVTRIETYMKEKK